MKPTNFLDPTSLRLFKDVVAQITDSVVITKANSINGSGPEIIYVNEAFTTITGYTKEEVLGKTPRILSGPETNRESLNYIRRALESLQPSQTELLNYKKNGEIFWIELEIVPIKDERGQVTHWVALQRDITLRKEMQQRALQDSQTRLAMTFDAVAEGVIVRDSVGWIVECNRSAENILGLNKAQLRGSLGDALWATTIHLNGTPLLEDESPYRRCCLTGEPLEGFILGLKIDEIIFKWLSFNAIPLKDETGKVTMVVTSFTDVTERKKAEGELILQKQLLRATNKALHKSESQMKALIEATPDSIFLKDGDGRMLLLNQAAVKNFTLTSIDYIGKTDKELAELVPAFKNVFLGCVESDELTWKAEQMQRMEEVTKTEEGNCHYFDVIKIPLFNPDGSRHGIVIIGRDVTERRLLETQLRQSQKMEAIGQLAGGLAHDFNNILAAILLNVEYLASIERLEDRASISKEMHLMIEHATALTRQLLMFSQQSTKKSEHLELNSMIRDLMKMLSRLIGSHIQIRQPQGTEVFWVEADKAMLNQVIMNVCINARDVMPRGGVITLELKAALDLPPSKIEQHKATGKKFVCLTIRDTGTGMNGDTLRRIFEPFFTTKEVGKGTGLGLAVVHGIMEQHEGWIEVESTLGKGSAFHLYFPTVTPDHHLVQRNQLEENPTQDSGVILYVEDLDSLRRITAKRLRDLGYDVLEAADAEQTLVLWGKHHHEIKLLLTDVVMPGSMSGFDLAKQLRKESANLGLVVVSGYAVEMLDFEDQGVEGFLFLPKPYEFAVLVKTINQVLAQIALK